jgi:hypothetical protein
MPVGALPSVSITENVPLAAKSALVEKEQT